MNTSNYRVSNTLKAVSGVTTLRERQEEKDRKKGKKKSGQYRNCLPATATQREIVETRNN
jgi:hypothetical protein